MSSTWTWNEIIKKNGLRDAVTLQRSIHDILNELQRCALADELKKEIEAKLDDAYWMLVDYTNARLKEVVRTSSN
ncbi:MAG: hypothetical protein WCE81_06825 [Halobacteriota archaeon]